MNNWIFTCAALIMTAAGSLAAAADDVDPAADPAAQDQAATCTLYTVGYAHLDTQWRWAYPLTIREYLPDTLHSNFALIDKYPNYIFNFSGANRYRMIQEYYPQDYAKLKQYIAAGRWFPCGSSMEECDVNCTSAESIIRQVLYGNQYFRSEFGMASDEFMLPDCFGFPASLPSLLAHCGLKGFSTQKLTWGSAMGIPFNIGVWEGLDGKYVIAAFNPGSYAASVETDLSQNADWLKRIQANGASSGVFADYHYYGTGDMGGSPTEDSVKLVEQAVNSTGPVKVLAARADQFFKDIPQDAVGKLPRFQGDLLLTEHSAGSITSQAYMKRWNRKCELLADSAERAAVTASLLGAAPYPHARLNSAWTLTLGTQFHDILPGTSLPKAYEYSWNDAVLAQNVFADVLLNAAQEVAAGLDTTAAGQPLVVFNSLSITREDVVEAEVQFSTILKTPTGVRVTGPDGADVPAQLVGVNGSYANVLFLAKLPAVSYAVFDVQLLDDAGIKAETLAVTERTLENQRYRVTVDDNGDIASVFDKLLDQELLTGPSRLVFTHDKPGYWPAWNIDWDDQQQPPYAQVKGPASFTITERGPVRIALTTEREAEGSKFIQSVRLSAGDAAGSLEVINEIDWRGRECNLKVEFPLTASNPLATYNWEAGKVQRGNNDPKKYEVPSHQWFDLTTADGSYGVTVLSPSKYGSDKPADNLLRLTLLRTPGTPELDYVDQATQDWGRHEIRYGLAGHRGDWRDGEADWTAMRFEQPLLAFQARQHAGQLGKQHSLMNVSSRGVRVMALKKAETSNDVILRVVELTGRGARNVEISLAVSIVSAREVDGQEREIGAANVQNGKLVVDLSPYSLHTYALSFTTPDGIQAAEDMAAVELPYNASVASRDQEAAASGFDSAGNCLPAEMLPRELHDGNVSYKLAPAGGNQHNAVRCDGQTLRLPAGTYQRLYLIAASAAGDQEVELRAGDRSYKLLVQDWSGYVGQWDNRMWEGDIPEEAFQWPYKYAGLVPGFIKNSPVIWFSSHRHSAQGANEIYTYSYLYRYAVDLEPGASNITLPVNPDILILAATVAVDGENVLQPAMELID